MTYELNTNALILRPVESADIAPLHSIWTDKAVRQFLWDGETIPLEQTKQIVMQSQALFDESGFGIWGIHNGLQGKSSANDNRNAQNTSLKDQHAFHKIIGFAGFWYFRTPPSLELLFGVTPEYWGQGIATEASQRLIRYGFEDLDFDVVEASTDVENKSSIRVLEKLGLSLHKRAVVEGLDTLFYRKYEPTIR